MAITNFGELKAELSSYEFHQRFAARYPNVTTLFENAANRRLRVRQMETSTLLTTISGVTTLPSDYLVWRTALWTGRTPYIEMDYVHPAYLQSSAIEDEHGDPKLFTIEGTSFKARPVRDDANAYEFHYYQKISTITGSDSASNWLMDANSDAYLFGVLTELSGLGRNVDMAQLYKARRDEVLAEIIQLSALTTGATSSQVRTAEYF